ncbi:hypothetical protein J6590_028631 [Homalodisca vitripennis]|nr:hypothetical protein J6590_028631 [Homalodisca vitripennis]
MAGQGRLQGQDRPAVTHPSSIHARHCLIRLSRDNHRTRYTASLASLRARDKSDDVAGVGCGGNIWVQSAKYS